MHCTHDNFTYIFAGSKSIDSPPLSLSLFYFCNGMGDKMTDQTGIRTRATWIFIHVIYQLNYLAQVFPQAWPSHPSPFEWSSRGVARHHFSHPFTLVFLYVNNECKVDPHPHTPGSYLHPVSWSLQWRLCRARTPPGAYFRSSLGPPPQSHCL